MRGEILFQHFGRVLAHRAELPHREELAIPPDTTMRVEHRSGRVQLHYCRYQQQQRHQHRRQGQYQKNVQGPFHHPVAKQLRWNADRTVRPRIRSIHSLRKGIRPFDDRSARLWRLIFSQIRRPASAQSLTNKAAPIEPSNCFYHAVFLHQLSRGLLLYFCTTAIVLQHCNRASGLLHHHLGSFVRSRFLALQPERRTLVESVRNLMQNLRHRISKSDLLRDSWYFYSLLAPINLAPRT